MASVAELQHRAASKLVVVLRPVPKHIYTSLCISFLEQAGQIVEFKRIKSKIYATFSTTSTATLACETLNGKCVPGAGTVPVSVQLYTHNFAGWRSSPTPTKLEHPTLPQPTPSSEYQQNNKPATPTPTSTLHFTGRYLLQLIKIIASASSSPVAGNDKLIRVLTLKRKNHTKEICESFGCTRALFDFDRVQCLELRKGQKKVVAFVPGDGCRPYTACALLLQVPKTWTIISVDPAMNSEKALQLTKDQPRLHCLGTTLESISLDESPVSDALRHADVAVVLAVHSHAPLQSFWTKLSSLPIPKICVSIPCCGDYGWLATKDLQYQYVDGEINSRGANTVLVYASGGGGGGKGEGGE